MVMFQSVEKFIAEDLFVSSMYDFKVGEDGKRPLQLTALPYSNSIDFSIWVTDNFIILSIKDNWTERPDSKYKYDISKLR